MSLHKTLTVQFKPFRNPLIGSGGSSTAFYNKFYRDTRVAGVYNYTPSYYRANENCNIKRQLLVKRDRLYNRKLQFGPY